MVQWILVINQGGGGGLFAPPPPHTNTRTIDIKMEGVHITPGGGGSHITPVWVSYHSSGGGGGASDLSDPV